MPEVEKITRILVLSIVDKTPLDAAINVFSCKGIELF